MKDTKQNKAETQRFYHKKCISAFPVLRVLHPSLATNSTLVSSQNVILLMHKISLHEV